MRLTDQEQVVLKAIYHVNRNGIAPIPDVLKAVGYPKATTKKILVGLERKDVVTLHRHDYAGSLAPAERKLLIRQQDGKGNWHYFGAVSVRKQNPRGKHLPGLPAKAQREYEAILKSVKASGRYKGREKEVAARTVKKQYGRRIRVKNKYFDLVAKGQATKTAQGWRVGKEVFPSGRGVVQVKPHVYLDKANGSLWGKRQRNTTRKRNIAGYRDESGLFHPIRSGQEARYSTVGGKKTFKGYKKSRKKYKPATVGEKYAYSPKKSAKRRAQSKRLKSAVASRKSTTKSLAGRGLSRTTSTGKRIKRKRNVQMMGGGGAYPIRASADYDPVRAGESPSRKSASAQSKKRRVTQKKIKAAGGVKSYLSKRKTRASAKTKAAHTKRHRKTVSSRKATTSRLAGRSLKKSSGLLKRRRRNPPMTLALVNRTSPRAKANRKQFAGEYRKDTPLYFPEGTPGGLSKLGKLLQIKTENVVVEPHTPTWLCRDTAGKLHLGTTSKDAVIWNGPKQDFGKVMQVDYEDVKKHLGYKHPQGFYHFMGEEDGDRPTLYADGKGGLKFKGGNYRFTSRGIEN
jgi:hypothetical protein